MALLMTRDAQQLQRIRKVRDHGQCLAIVRFSRRQISRLMTLCSRGKCRSGSLLGRVARMRSSLLVGCRHVFPVLATVLLVPIHARRTGALMGTVAK